MEEVTIGKRIMTLRKQKSMTQEQLAERVGVSAQAVSKWENDVSCPDISLIPQLADVLGVTTDELLGVKPLEPHVVVVDTGSGKQGKNGSAKYEFRWESGAKDSIWFAAVLILAGLAFLLSQFGVLPFGKVSFWGVVWPAVVLGIGVSWTVNHFSPLGIGVALLGLYYLLFNLGAATFVLTWNMIWPSALVLLGITILVDKFLPHKRGGFHVNGDHEPRTEFSDTEGYVHMDAAFCSERRAASGTEEFRGGDIDMSFGEGTLDLTSVTSVSSGALLKVDVSFGSLTLILPRKIRAVAGEIDKSFGSTSTHGVPDEDAAYSIRVSGDVSFGSLDIRYV